MMQNIATKSFIYILIGVSAIVWFGLAVMNGLNLSKATDFFSLVPKVVTVDLFLLAVFSKWGWKLTLFQGWLVPFPDLNGTWMGHIYSDWVNPETGEKPQPIPVMLTVKQSFLNISCLMHTGEMISSSYSEGFAINSDRQLKQLAYSYTSRPRIALSERSTPHDGTAVFQIIEKPQKKLVGRYWTERLTKGEVKLNFYCKDILEELPDDVGDHPVTEENNKR